MTNLHLVARTERAVCDAYDEVTYTEQVPFPHIVMDGLIDPGIATFARMEFDQLPDEAWQVYANATEQKLAARFDQCSGLNVAYLRSLLAGRPFVGLLEGLFNIGPLHFDDLGGGLHRIKPGGHLDLHVDFNTHPNGRYRRLNCLLFLNTDPDPSADLFLVDSPTDPKQVRRIRPTLGRLVVFATSDTSWHGHPIPLEGPERRSLAAYYYTDERPDDYSTPHDTIYPTLTEQAGGFQ